MNLPEQPPTFRQPTAAERPWWWRLEDAAGGEVEASEDLAGQRFVSQADAESWVGEAWQELIFRKSKDLEMKAGEAFSALYRAFLDRTNGPRAGWLLASLDRAFVVNRLREASR